MSGPGRALRPVHQGSVFSGISWSDSAWRCFSVLPIRWANRVPGSEYLPSSWFPLAVPDAHAAPGSIFRNSDGSLIYVASLSDCNIPQLRGILPRDVDDSRKINIGSGTNYPAKAILSLQRRTPRTRFWQYRLCCIETERQTCGILGSDSAKCMARQPEQHRIHPNGLQIATEDTRTVHR